MNRVKIFITIFTLATSANLFAQNPDASITFSNPVHENHISLFVNTNSNAEAFTELVTKDTMNCLHIPNDKYAYFRVDDATISENDNKLIIQITYFDEGYGSVSLQYNATNSINYARQTFKKTT